MSTNSVPRVHIADADLQSWPLPAEWITQGQPNASGLVLAKSDDSCVVRGIWDCTPGQFRWNFTYDETLVIVKGHATVELESGETVVLNPGDMAFFPRGQWSTWTIHERLRKAFHADSPEPLPF
jgi:uncharacterized cupin superfamily protein